MSHAYKHNPTIKMIRLFHINIMKALKSNSTIIRVAFVSGRAVVCKFGRFLMCPELDCYKIHIKNQLLVMAVAAVTMAVGYYIPTSAMAMG